MARLILMPAHLLLDLGTGVLLAASPWLFGFAGEVWGPHVVVGAMEVGAALMTRTVPGTSRAAGPAAGRFA